LKNAERFSFTSLDICINLFSSFIVIFQLDFKELWLSFKPILERLFEEMKKKCLISATSVPSGSIFSIAGNIQRKESCRLSSRMLRFLILAKQNNIFEKTHQNKR
jgi:hypothetical protein